MVTALILQLVQCIVSPPDDNSLTTPLLLPDTPTDPASDTPTKVSTVSSVFHSIEVSFFKLTRIFDKLQRHFLGFS